MYAACHNEDATNLQHVMMDPYHGLFKVETWHGGQPVTRRRDIKSGRILVGLLDECCDLPFNNSIVRAANVLLRYCMGLGVQANMAIQVNRSPSIHSPSIIPLSGYRINDNQTVTNLDQASTSVVPDTSRPNTHSNE